MNTHQNYQDANAAVIDRWITEGWEWGSPLITKRISMHKTDNGL